MREIVCIHSTDSSHCLAVSKERTVFSQVIGNLSKEYAKQTKSRMPKGRSTSMDIYWPIGQKCRKVGEKMALTDYEVDLYLRQKWQDERLKHPDITEVLDLNDPNLVKAIWKPEVYFPNAKHAEFQFVTVPNVLIRINPDGEILYMLREIRLVALGKVQVIKAERMTL
uniref:Neur_chan_LBD domain-containing protein n=1 Tax=Rhodnius prolixus TaxID=13249 RepID=T1HB07_RHOPR